MSKNFSVPNFQQIQQELFLDIAKQIAGQAISHFKGSFFKQGFTDASFIAWPKRRDDLTHKLLRLDHNLINSIKATTVNKDSVEIQAGEGIPYAAIHNNGGIIKVRVTARMRRFFWYMYKKTEKEKWKAMALTKKTVLKIRIPQRQYIGNSQVLKENIDKTIAAAIQRSIRKLAFEV